MALNFWVASLFSPLRLLLLYPNWPSHCPVGEMSETLHNLSLRYIRTPDPFHVCLYFSSINHEPVLVKTWSCVPSPGPALLPTDPWMKLSHAGSALSFILLHLHLVIYCSRRLYLLLWTSCSVKPSLALPGSSHICYLTRYGAYSWRWRFSYS